MDIKMKLKRKRNGSFFFLFHDLTRKELKNLYVQLFLLILYFFYYFQQTYYYYKMWVPISTVTNKKRKIKLYETIKKIFN